MAAAASEASVADAAVYVVTVRSLSPQYDVYVDLHQEVHVTPTLAIEACRRLFVTATRGWFRETAPDNIYGVAFDPTKVESYKSDHMSNLYQNGGEGDSPSIYTSPGGPVVGQVVRYARAGAGWDNAHPAVIYQLPLARKAYHHGQKLELHDTGVSISKHEGASSGDDTDEMDEEKSESDGDDSDDAGAGAAGAVFMPTGVTGVRGVTRGKRS